MVGQRRGLLNYLQRVDIERYRAIIEKIKLKKIEWAYFSSILLK